MPLLKRFAFVFLFASCSFGPNLDGATCGPSGLCPSGYLCGSDGKCHQSIQSGVDGPPMHDGSTIDAAPDAPATCGNGRIDPNETCDPAIPAGMMGHCPTQADCSDGDSCTTDTLQGSALSCTASCTHTPITTCGGADGCCPGGIGCNHNTDPDCSASCGNGAVESGETCDKAIPHGMQGACPTLADCDDSDACTSDAIVGSADACTAQCLHQAVTTCGPREGCCPSSCNATNDPDCSPVCGNNVLESGETCDPPSSCPQDVSACNDNNDCTVDTFAGSAANCTAQCQHTPIMVCNGGDRCCAPGCNANSDSDCAPVCGNNVVEMGEICDPPARCPASVADCNDNNSCTIDTYTGSAASCTGQCHHALITTCNNTANDGCCPAGCNSATDRDCLAVCGNGILEGGEQCDTGIPSGPGKCPTLADCNDGNPCTVDSVQGTGCHAQCVHTPDTSCSPSGNSCCPPGCNANNDVDCAPMCGNGVVESGEFCDTAIGSGLPGHCPVSSADCNDNDACTVDGVTGMGCQTHCTHVASTCSFTPDGCCPSGCNANTDSDCMTVCGNGILEPGELCDTGIAPGNPGACPTSCPPPTQMCTSNTLQNAGTCQAQCVQTSGGTCSTSMSDNCCTISCNSSNDIDCPSSWIASTIASNVPFMNNTTCVNLPVNLVAGHWYVITTCGPANPALGGAGDTTLTLFDPFNAQVGFDDDCYDQSWIPLSAGWSCLNGNGSSYASCVANGNGIGSPTGFRATVTGTYTVCLKAFSTCTPSGNTTCRANVTLWSN